MEQCAYCGGSGFISGGGFLHWTCPACGGGGVIREHNPLHEMKKNLHRLQEEMKKKSGKNNEKQ